MRKISLLSLSIISSPLAYATCLSNDTHCTEWQLSPLVGYYQYEEPNLMKVKGPLLGVEGTVFHANSTVALLSQVKIAYNFGSYSSNGSGSISNFPSYYINLSQSIGHRFAFPANLFAITPYIGLGYRYLENDSSDKISTLGFSGYMRQSNYFYIPFGIWMDYRPANWIMQSKVEFDWMFYGSQYSGVDGGVRNTQRNGYGFNANFLIGQPISETSTLLMGPYFEYWNIPDSNIVAGNIGRWMEPKNSTIEAGLMMTYSF